MIVAASTQLGWTRCTKLSPNIGPRWSATSEVVLDEDRHGGGPNHLRRGGRVGPADEGSVMKKPCLDCGAAQDFGTRCEGCTVTHARRSVAPRVRTYDRRSHLANPARWKALSKRLRRAQNFCLRCGSRFRLQVDHVDPDGPEWDVANLQILCASCHGKKGGGPPPAPVGVPAAWGGTLSVIDSAVARG